MRSPQGSSKADRTWLQARTSSLLLLPASVGLFPLRCKINHLSFSVFQRFSLKVGFWLNRSKAAGRTRVLRERWSTGSSGSGCRASGVCWPGTPSSGSPQTCCRCGRWQAASWGANSRGYGGAADLGGPSGRGGGPSGRGGGQAWAVLTSCCCPQRRRSRACRRWWAAAGRSPPSPGPWTAPPEPGTRRQEAHV